MILFWRQLYIAFILDVEGAGRLILSIMTYYNRWRFFFFENVVMTLLALNLNVGFQICRATIISV